MSNDEVTMVARGRGAVRRCALARPAARSATTSTGGGGERASFTAARRADAEELGETRARSTSSPGRATPRTAPTTRGRLGDARSRRRPAARSRQDFGTSDEAVNLMKTGDYDVVSASGDARCG